MTPVNTRTRLAAIYARVSTEEQARGLVESTKTQVEKCKEKAHALGIPVASQDSGLIVEEQHSGADLRWEGTLFMQLVRRAEAHDFTDLICLDLDRFCRGGADAYGQQKGLLFNAGVTVHYVMTDFGENMPFRGSMEAIMADAAQWLRDKSREASIRNRAEWARQGNITPGNTPPFGFQWVEDATRLSRKNRPVKVGLIPDPVTGPILLHMTQHVANGGGVRLLKRGYRTRASRRRRVRSSGMKRPSDVSCITRPTTVPVARSCHARSSVIMLHSVRKTARRSIATCRPLRTSNIS